MVSAAAFLVSALAACVWLEPAAAVLRGQLRLPGASQAQHRRHQRSVERRASSAPSTAPWECQAAAPAVNAPKDNVWASLTAAETASLMRWLYGQRELNLTARAADPPLGSLGGGGTSGPTWDNTVVLVELMRPNKSDVLDYLDGKAVTAAPPRFAHVMISNTTTNEPYYQDLLVGPLPVDNKTTRWQPLTYPYTKKGGEGKVRDILADSEQVYLQWLIPIGLSLANVTKDLWNITLLGANNAPNILPIAADPLWQDDGRVKRWDQFYGAPTDQFDAGTLLPLGLFLLSDITGRDPTKWTVDGWLYNDIFYESTDAFLKAYWAPGFQKLGAPVEGDWARTDRQGEPLPLDDKPPPMATASSTPRFSVDVARQYVEWMDFSFYIGFSRDTGLSLFDVRYHGERVLFELGLQEALAHYAGNDPYLSSVAYLDSFYGFGPVSFELVPGFDCPQYATYLNSSYYLSQTVFTNPNSICMFEFDADHAIQRHSADSYSSVTKNTQFTVRAVSSIGNYDYTFSYTFALDGSVSVDVRASGYIEGAFGVNNGDYGFQIHDWLNGAMHDHVLNFKADLDVLGLANSVMVAENVAVSKSYPWSGGKKRNTMQLQKRFIENEDQARMDWAPNSRQALLIVNKEAKNQHGEYRAWKVQPTTPGAHLTVKDSSSLVESARWAEYDVQISRRKDTEPRAAHPYNNQDVHDPPINFAHFFDGESLTQEDLVVWVNVGMHHVPHTGDLPNTVMTAAAAGFKLVPTNYFDNDPSRRSRGNVRVSYNASVVTDVVNSGRAQVCESDLWKYTGDVVAWTYGSAA